MAKKAQSTSSRLYEKGYGSRDMISRPTYIGQLGDEVKGIGLSHGPLDVLVTCVGVAVLDVFLDGAAEQHGLLTHDPDMVPEPTQVQVLDVVAVNQDLALEGIVEPLDQLDAGGLAGSRAAHQGDGPSLGHVEGDPAQDLAKRGDVVRYLYPTDKNLKGNVVF